MNRKDRECIKRTGFPCVRIPQSLYDAAEREGYDLSGYIVQETMPTHRGSMMGKSEYKTGPQPWDSGANVKFAKHQRKHLSERQCSGKQIACLPGKSGKCVACGEDD